MKRMQNSKIFFLSVVIIIIAIFMPPTISHIKDRMLFGQVKTQPLHKNLPIAAASMNVVDKIALISNYGKSSENVVMVSQEQQQGSKLTEQDAPVIALKELEKLQKNDIFPKIDLDNEFKCNYTLMTFSDITQPGDNVLIWDMTFTFGKNMINLMIDADTHIIYQFYIWSNELLPAMDTEAIPSKFAEYIGIKWDSKSYNQFGHEQYSAANGKIYYNFSREEEVKGLKGLSINIVSEENTIKG